ncbi:hypothetical protein BMH30_02395, partial [Leucobacter sp. OLES1]
GAGGRRADGSWLAGAIAMGDAATGGGIEAYLVNCAHPSEVAAGLDDGSAALSRIAGFRLNAARDGDDGACDGPTRFAAGADMLIRQLVRRRLVPLAGLTTPRFMDVLTPLLAMTRAISIHFPFCFFCRTVSALLPSVRKSLALMSDMPAPAFALVP